LGREKSETGCESLRMMGRSVHDESIVSLPRGDVELFLR
jgi:hypothetical protein